MTFTRAQGALAALAVGLAGGVLGSAAFGRIPTSPGWLADAHRFLASNLTLAVLLSLLIFLTSWRRDRLTLSTNLNKQIQDYNLAVFKDRTLASHLAAVTFPRSDAAWMQGLYAVFYTINMVRDGKRLRERLFVPANDLFREDEFIWLTAEDYPEQLIYILDGERGYHQDFKDFVWSILRQRYSDAWIDEVRQRNRDRLAASEEGSSTPAPAPR